MNVASASFAYPEHDGGVRAELARRTRGRHPERGMVLSTCLRWELTVPGDGDDLVATLDRLTGGLPPGVDPVIREGDAAVTHLYRVAAGLESPIVGEIEVLTQFRRAVIEAEQAGTVTGLFAGLLESAVAVGRKARELLPASPHNSMAAVAAQAVGTAPMVAVLGSGVMATSVVDSLLQLPAPPEVTVVARSPDKVSHDNVEVWPFARAGEALASFPAVVSATSAKRRLVDDLTMARIVEERTQPLILVDMAMPPDFEPPSSAAVSYHDIDDLARLADRRARTPELDEMVATEAEDAYLRLRHHQEVAPLIGGLYRSADEVVDRIVDRFAGRLGHGDDAALLRQAAHTVARTLLAGPVAYVKETPEAVEVIADAFGVEDG